MADPVMLGGLGQALIDVVDPLRRALSSPDAFEALMRRQGWKPPPTREYFAVVSDAFKLVGAVETAIASIQSLLDGDSSDPGALLAGIDALAKVIADLRAIRRPPGRFRRPSTPTNSGPRSLPTSSPLCSCATWRWRSRRGSRRCTCSACSTKRPSIRLARRAGCLHAQQGRMGPPRHVVLGSRIARARRLRLGQYVQARHAARRLERVLLAFGIPTGRYQPHRSLVDQYHGGTFPPDDVRELRIPLVEERRPGSGFVRAGLLVLPIPPSDTPTAAPTGFFIGPYAYGQAAARVDLAGPLALELKGGLESGGNVDFEVRPQSFGAHLGTAGTDLNLEAALAIEPPAPLLLLGSEQSHRIQIGKSRLGLSLTGPPRRRTSGSRSRSIPCRSSSILPTATASSPSCSAATPRASR